MVVVGSALMGAGFLSGTDIIQRGLYSVYIRMVSLNKVSDENNNFYRTGTYVLVVLYLDLRKMMLDRRGRKVSLLGSGELSYKEKII
jgi:hypothetical protein